MRLIDALEDFYLSMDGAYSPNTLKWYRHKLQPLIWSMGDCHIEEITIQMLRAWRADLANKTTTYEDHPTKPTKEGPMSRHTLHGHVRACRRFFKWLEEEELMDHNPAKRLELPAKPKGVRKGIKEKERDLIIEKARTENPRDYAIVLFLADTACRVAGLAGLTLNRLDLDNLRAEVHEKGKGGNNKARLVYFGEKTKQAIEEWLRVRPKSPDCLFVFVNIHKKGGVHGLTVSGVYHAIERIAEKVGVKSNWNPHNWRHGSARGMIKKGASLSEVSQILGHSSVTVTGDFYGIFSEEELHESHRTYAWIE
jgi:integrase/recombinase XerD